MRASLPVLARVLLFWCAYLAVLSATGMLRPPVPPHWRAFIATALGVVGVLGATFLFLGMERRPAGAIGLVLERGTLVRFLVGVVAGLALFWATIAVTSWLSGPAGFVVHTHPGHPRMKRASATYLAIATLEELGFRGYPLRTLHAALGLWPAQLLVMVAFGLMHMAFGWSLGNVLMGVLPGALLFGLLAIASRGLALPIGVHAAWNFASWSIGADGPFMMVVREGARERVALAGRISSIAVLLLAALATWGWYHWRARRDTAERVAVPA